MNNYTNTLEPDIGSEEWLQEMRQHIDFCEMCGGHYLGPEMCEIPGLISKIIEQNQQENKTRETLATGVKTQTRGRGLGCGVLCCAPPVSLSGRRMLF